jgi:hypothetical protein
LWPRRRVTAEQDESAKAVRPRRGGDVVAAVNPVEALVTTLPTAANSRDCPARSRGGAFAEADVAPAPSQAGSPSATSTQGLPRTALAPGQAASKSSAPGLPRTPELHLPPGRPPSWQTRRLGFEGTRADTACRARQPTGQRDDGGAGRPDSYQPQALATYAGKTTPGGPNHRRVLPRQGLVC